MKNLIILVILVLFYSILLQLNIILKYKRIDIILQYTIIKQYIMIYNITLFQYKD